MYPGAGMNAAAAAAVAAARHPVSTTRLKFLRGRFLLVVFFRILSES